MDEQQTFLVNQREVTSRLLVTVGSGLIHLSHLIHRVSYTNKIHKKKRHKEKKNDGRFQELESRGRLRWAHDVHLECRELGIISERAPRGFSDNGTTSL
jgi:hypothetical protein